MSTTHNEEQLVQEAMDQLAKTNPATPGVLDAKGEALYQRVTRTEPTLAPASWTRRMAMAAGGLAAVAVVAVASVAVMGGGGNNNDGGQLPADGGNGGASGGIAGSCLAFSEDELLRREFAFRGRATDVTDTTVTFEVVEAYAGDRGSEVTLELDSTLQSELYADFTFAEGEEYLVSGDGEFAWGCGYSRPYDGETAASWAAVLSGGGSQVIGGDSAASCAVSYSPEALLERDHAFDGVLVSISEGTGPGGIEYPQLTFEVRESFNGADAGTVTLLGSALDYGYESGPEPTLEVGGRYLVAGDAEFAWGCGFTRNHNDADDDAWSAAFAD